MSTINTNGIDGNYPTPGQNNSSEGFRDNFTAIKNNLNTAGKRKDSIGVLLFGCW